MEEGLTGDAELPFLQLPSALVKPLVLLIISHETVFFLLASSWAAAF